MRARGAGSTTARLATGALLAAGLLLAARASVGEPPPRPFGIRVVDAATGRGVPLVELETTSALLFVTDSAGWVAVDEPGLLGQRVFFTVRAHGYEHVADGFGQRGRAFDVRPGGRATLEVTRAIVAERLYRVTGQGIYADSLRLGLPVPLAQPALAGQVTGQDSVQMARLGDRLWWFWGDTNRLAYPLGQFGTAGATSAPPGAGGLDPDVGVDLRYVVDAEGFSRPMFVLGEPGMVWMDGVCVLPDASGRERLLAHFARMQDLGTRLGHGIAVLDETAGRFEPLATLPNDARLFPQGHALRVADPATGRTWIHFATPYPSIRVEATWEAFLDPARYEALTPLRAGSAWDPAAPALDRDGEGRVRYTWKRATALVPRKEEKALVERGAIPADDCPFHTMDAATRRPVLLHAGSVAWNAWRERYVMIAHEAFGGPSFLGEVWYAEAERTEGPWRRAIKVASHDRYSFYNVRHHAEFDQEGGRVVFFEGTYTRAFSATQRPTPRYDYNQVMYRLDLADARLALAR